MRKRRNRSLMRAMDDAMKQAIHDGKRSRQELMEVFREFVGRMPMNDFFSFFGTATVNSHLQRLRQSGEIELVKGRPVPVGELTDHDVEHIDQRTSKRIAGYLRSRILFNKRHGRLDAAAEASAQLSLLGRFDELPTEAAPVVAKTNA